MDTEKKNAAHNKKKSAVEGRTSLYNPLLQKPVALHPVGPGSYPAGYGGYAYIGPPPDFGGTYGKFQDTAGREQYGIKSSKMFSIYDGSPTQFHAELSPEEREALLSQMDQVVAEYKCEHCRSQLAVSVGKKMDEVFCPHCGSQMAGAAEKVKQCVSKIEEMKMSTKPNTIEAKAKKAKSTVDVAKEAMKKEHPAKHNEKVEPKAAEMHDLKEAQKGIEKKEPMKELAKDMVKAEADKKAEILAKKKERMKAAVQAYKEKKKQEALAKVTAKKQAVKKQKPVKAELTDEQKKLRRELRIMAALEPAKFAEVKKNEKLSAICAEVEGKIVSKADRIKVRAELAVLAAEDAQAADELTKQLDFIAPEILMEEKIEVSDEEKKEGKEEAAAEHATVDADKKEEASEHEVAKEEKKEDEEGKAEGCGDAAAETEEILEDESAFSMQTEFLASLDNLKGEIVEMSLYDQTSENPYWNVTVDGEPVGRIYLQDQAVEDPQAIRAAFCNESYSTNFGEAVRSVGLKRLLTITKAKLFAHRLDDAEVTARLREKAKEEVRAEMDEKLTTLRADFMKAVSLAMVAADKNFYQEEAGHKLKEGLFNSLVQAGLNEEGAVWAIEAGFENSAEYFDFIMAKAQEIMDMPSQAREAIEKQILASGKMQIKVEQPEEETLSQRLIKSSVNVIAMGGQVSGEHREQIRSQLKLSANRK